MDEFIKQLDFTHGKYREYEIFFDIIKLTAFFIQSNLLFNLSNQKEYEDILNKYNEKEQTKIKELIIQLCLLYDKQETPKDIIGTIFHRLNANNKQTGQFFTPVHLQQLCSSLIGIDYKELEEKGYITLQEPSCGSGGMIVSYAEDLQNKGINYHKQLLVKAQDLDIICSYMTYVQLSLYDIPAIVINGDSLINKINFVLYTPQYIYGNWSKKSKLNEV